MKCCVLFGSPRGAESNTRALLNEFLDEWQAAGHTFVTYSLYGEAISPCMACRGCQWDWSGPNCVIDDDMTAFSQFQVGVTGQSGIRFDTDREDDDFGLECFAGCQTA